MLESDDKGELNNSLISSSDSSREIKFLSFTFFFLNDLRANTVKLIRINTLNKTAKKYQSIGPWSCASSIAQSIQF